MNVLLFRLKNASSEFQKILNGIFNNFQDFTIVYIDDVSVFSSNIEKHFKHINIFMGIIKRIGLVVSLLKSNYLKKKLDLWVLKST